MTPLQDPLHGNDFIETCRFANKTPRQYLSPRQQLLDQPATLGPASGSIHMSQHWKPTHTPLCTDLLDATGSASNRNPPAWTSRSTCLISLRRDPPHGWPQPGPDYSSTCTIYRISTRMSSRYWMPDMLSGSLQIGILLFVTWWIFCNPNHK